MTTSQSYDDIESWLSFIDKGKGIQGWISDMGIDGPTFVPKRGYFLPIWVKVGLKKLAFSYYFSQFYELTFQTKCWLFQARNPPLSLFLAFLTVVFLQFYPDIYHLKGHFLTKKAP